MDEIDIRARYVVEMAKDLAFTVCQSEDNSGDDIDLSNLSRDDLWRKMQPQNKIEFMHMASRIVSQDWRDK